MDPYDYNDDNDDNESQVDAPLEPVGSGEYVVQQGEALESIAYAHGFFWETLWDHGQNAEVKKVRKDPHVLLAGDKLHIPDIRKKQVNGSPEKKHRFRRKGVPGDLKLQLKKHGKVRANLEYVLDIDGDVRSGKTDGEGWIKEKIPPDAKRAELRIDGGKEIHKLDLGGLNPIESPSGMKMRLKNLGYYNGDESSDKVTHNFKAALRAFQKQVGLEPTGKRDQATMDKLKQVHGS